MVMIEALATPIRPATQQGNQVRVIAGLAVRSAILPRRPVPEATTGHLAPLRAGA